MTEELERLRDQVIKFQTFQLPGQPKAAHMGTNYLVSDLLRALEQSETKRESAELGRYAINFGKQLEALEALQGADLTPELDQHARDLARLIMEHGKDYTDTEYGDMTAPLMEALRDLVCWGADADRERNALRGKEAHLKDWPEDRGEPHIGRSA